MLVAWVDESVRVSAGAYVLAAYVADSTSADSVGVRLAALSSARSARIHWRHESDRVRQRVLQALQGVPGDVLAVVGVGLSGSKQERARRLCMQALLFEMERSAVRTVILEQRTPSLNARDLLLVEALRGKRWLSPQVTVEFGDPEVEPALWVADVACGVIGALVEGDTRWWELMPLDCRVVTVRIGP